MNIYIVKFWDCGEVYIEVAVKARNDEQATEKAKESVKKDCTVNDDFLKQYEDITAEKCNEDVILTSYPLQGV